MIAVRMVCLGHVGRLTIEPLTAVDVYVATCMLKYEIQMSTKMWYI